MIRIIAGQYKGRVIPTLKTADYRPSTGKFREALFNILTSGQFKAEDFLNQAKVLDLFAGTGSLSFEALSRGALSATLVDSNAEYLKAAKEFAEKIGELERVSFLKTSAINLPYANQKYNLILMDPPYYKDLASKALKSLIAEKWLEDKAIIAIEVSKSEDIKLPHSIEIIDQRVYGNNKLIILQYVEN